jgi:predicted Zn-ribbon and HTH transcriptional regulator
MEGCAFTSRSRLKEQRTSETGAAALNRRSPRVGVVFADGSSKERKPMRYDELPHAGINTLMHWASKQEQQVVKLETWAQSEQWTAHITLQGTRPLHARIKRRGYHFTVSRIRSAPACPRCSAGDLAAQAGPSPSGLASELPLVAGDY